jgi:coatomer subunit zeta
VPQSSSIPPLLPKLDAILVLDGDGNRLAGKYYNTAFLKKAVASDSAGGGAAMSVTDSKVAFEKLLQAKLAGISARADAAEVVTVAGRTAVFCGGTAGATGGGGDVRIVHLGPPGESELVLSYLCEGMYDALLQLMGGSADRNMVLDNLELVFLLIDEHCDGGIILEVDGSKLAAAVMLRDEERDVPGQGSGAGGGAGGGGAHHPGGMAGGAADMTIGQALRQAREQFMANMTSRDGM